LTVAGQTPWQTTGPFFHFGLAQMGGADLTGESALGARPDLVAPGHDRGIWPTGARRQGARGERIEIVGSVADNRGTPVIDYVVEIWQANAEGRYAHPDDPRRDLPVDPCFPGYGRGASDAQGLYRFRTVRPGRVPGPGNTLQAPHIALGLAGPGFLKRLTTRIYFPDAPANAEDPILAFVPEARRSTLIAEPAGANSFRFDIRLGGERETVFFDI
jgi:protocatechuate 3,4-dioxygenase, alpha subunit